MTFPRSPVSWQSQNINPPWISTKPISSPGLGLLQQNPFQFNQHRSCNCSKALGWQWAGEIHRRVGRVPKKKGDSKVSPSTATVLPWTVLTSREDTRIPEKLAPWLRSLKKIPSQSGNTQPSNAVWTLSVREVGREYNTWRISVGGKNPLDMLQDLIENVSFIDLGGRVSGKGTKSKIIRRLWLHLRHSVEVYSWPRPRDKALYRNRQI